MIQPTQTIKFCYCQKILSETNQLIVCGSIQVSFPKWFDHESILRVHHKIAFKIIEHDCVTTVVELQKQSMKRHSGTLEESPCPFR